jgi:hypothetical protein
MYLITSLFIKIIKTDYILNYTQLFIILKNSKMIITFHNI